MQALLLPDDACAARVGEPRSGEILMRARLFVATLIAGLAALTAVPAEAGYGGPGIGRSTISLQSFAEKRRAFLLNHREVKKSAL